MKKSKIILLFSILVILISIIRLKTNLKSSYNLNDNYIEGTIVEKKIYENRITFTVKGKEKILVNCYDCKITSEIGDYIKAFGKFKIPNDNSVFYLFNYKKYLKSKKINYIFTVKDFELLKKIMFYIR